MTHIPSEDERFATFLRSAVQDLDIPETPREEMWAAISARRQRSSPPVTAWATYVAQRDTPALTLHQGGAASHDKDVAQLPVRRFPAVPMRWAMPAAAAILAAGVWIGVRVDRPRVHSAATVAFVAPAKLSPVAAERLIVDKHFVDAEQLMVKYTNASSTETAKGQAVTEAELSRWANQLLTSTQVLLDNNKEITPERRKLLSDLETVLAQIATPSGLPGEREFTEQSIEHVMPRLKYEVPQAMAQRGI